LVSALIWGKLSRAASAVLASKIVHGLNRAVVDAQRIGSYRLIERLGRGGMGEVWKAHHQLLARPAAVKLISQDALRADVDGSLPARFDREAQATACLESEHTIRLFDFGVTSEGTIYYAMELLDGLDLTEVGAPHRTPQRYEILESTIQELRIEASDDSTGCNEAIGHLGLWLSSARITRVGAR
jgi:serine/threonine protein kinase